MRTKIPARNTSSFLIQEDEVSVNPVIVVIPCLRLTIYVRPFLGYVEDSFCANCPVEDRREENFVESSRAFASECGEDGSCTADLEIKATFPGDHRYATCLIFLFIKLDILYVCLVYSSVPFTSSEYVIGSTKVIPFKVDVTNHGEPAYVPRLEIQLPGQTRLQGKKVDELCDKPSLGQFGEWRYSCRLKANPLKHSKTVKMRQSHHFP